MMTDEWNALLANKSGTARELANHKQVAAVMP
jgi:hypothetical protein